MAVSDGRQSLGSLGTYRGSAAIRLGRQKIDEIIQDSAEGLARLDARVHKWVLLSAVKALLPNHSTAFCCSTVLPPERRGVVGVEIWKSKKYGNAHYGNLFTCGYVWTCSICGPKIAMRRAVEIERAISSHQASGGRVMFLTLTVPHYVRDDLKQLISSFSDGLRSFWSRRALKDVLRRVGFLGSIRALEVTYGNNGWHPHTHYLLFVGKDAEVSMIEERLRSEWSKVVDKYLSRDVNGYGLELILVGNGIENGGTDEDAQQIARYVVKGLEDSIWGIPQEMTRGHIKKGRVGGRTPFALLHDYAVSDDKQAGALFVEFVEAFHGRRQLTWSKSLRKKLFGIDIEVTDQELAEQVEDDAVLLGTLTLDQWWRVLAAPCKDTRGLLLEVAALSGWEGVEVFLEGLPPLKVRVVGQLESNTALLSYR